MRAGASVVAESGPGVVVPLPGVAEAVDNAHNFVASIQRDRLRNRPGLDRKAYSATASITSRPSLYTQTVFRTKILSVFGLRPLHSPPLLYSGEMHRTTAMLVALCTTVVSASQIPGDAGRFEAEIKRWVGEDHPFSIPDGSHVVLEIFQGKEPVPQEEIERLERLAPLDRNYEHELQLALSVNEHGGERRRVGFYFGNERLWRINTDYLTYSSIEYDDTARGVDRAWLLTPGQVQLGSASRGFQAADQRFAVTTTLTGYLTDWKSSLLDERGEITNIMVDGARASFLVTRKDRTFRIEGRFEPRTAGSLDDFRVEAIQINDPSGSPIGTTAMSEWRFNPHLSRIIPHLYESFNADRTLESSIRLIELTPLMMDIHAITATPKSPDGEDALRGRFTFTSIYDQGRNEAALFDAESGQQLISQTPGTFGGYRGYAFAIGIVLVGSGTFLYLHRSWAR